MTDTSALNPAAPASAPPRRLLSGIAITMLVTLTAGACTFSSDNRADDLASATATPEAGLDQAEPANEPAPNADEADEVAAAADEAAEDAATDEPEDQEPQAPPPPDWVTISGVEEALNVRGGPGTDFDVLGQVALGETVATTGNQEGPADARWMEIRFEGGDGWIFASYSTPAETVPTPTPFATPTPLATPTPIGAQAAEVVVDAPDGLNMRGRPNTDAKVIRELDDGEVLATTGRTRTDDTGRDWVEVEIGGETGWVAAEFVEAA